MMIRYEDGKWINNIGVYFLILKELNEDLLQLINHDSSYDEKIKLLFFKLAVNLNRIFPIQHKSISKNDGILRIRKSIDFLGPEYKKIFKEYKNDFITINDIRNKFEHAPHIIKWKHYIGNNKEKKLRFINDEYNLNIIEGNEEEISKNEEYDEKLEWIIDTDMFVKIVIPLDEIFIKIQEKLSNYFKDNTEALAHPYISSILNFNLSSYIDRLKFN